MIHCIMSNSSLRMIGSFHETERCDLDAVMYWVFNRHTGVVGWKELHDPTRDKGKVLMLYWGMPHGPHNVNRFLAKLNEKEAKMAVIGWLRQEEITDELKDSDADEVHDGFEAWTDMWGHGTTSPEDGDRTGDAYCMLSIRKRTRQIGK